MIKIKDKGTDNFEGFTLGEKVAWKLTTWGGVSKTIESRIIGFGKEHMGFLQILIESNCEESYYKVQGIVESFKNSKRTLSLLKCLNPDSTCVWVSKFDILPLEPKEKNNPLVKPDPNSIRKPSQEHKHDYAITTDIKKEDDNPVSDIKKAVSFEPSSHYEFGNGLNCMTFIEEAVKDLKGIEAFYVANAIKYLFRTTKKNGDDDLKKAHNYLTLTLKKRGIL